MILRLSQSSTAFNALYKDVRATLIRYSDRNDRLLAFGFKEIQSFDKQVGRERIFFLDQLNLNG